ncbi:MAG TPA: glycosyltransferase [Casimicrobiaceae bacterium]|nr:glycosyltransferase [Casimicrobiaceae bacterium]
MTEVPNVFHFVFGLAPQSGPLHVVHYLCLESCRRVYRPDAIHFHCRHEPHGEWWERIRPHLTLRRISGGPQGGDARRYAETEEGRFIERAGWTYAHEADFVRLDVLAAEGGVYADMDTLFVQPLPRRIFGHDFVIGEEPPLPGADGVLRPSLCNALMLARPAAAFAVRWRARMAEAFDGTWSRHSCVEAARIWAELPDAVHVVPQRYFYRHAATRAGIAALVEAFDPDLHDVYSMHLWAHLWWDAWRTDFTTFHAGLLTAEHIRSVDTTYNVVARGFLD